MKNESPLFFVAVIGLIAAAFFAGSLWTGKKDELAVAANAKTSSGAKQKGGRNRGGYKPAVSMDVASDATISKKIEVLGQARAQKSIGITSEVTGLVTKVHISPGVRIKKGDVLLQVEDETQRITLNRIRSQYPLAKLNSERYRELADDDAGSDLEAEEAFNVYKGLEAELRSAEFALDQRTIKAPFNGIAGITEIEAGDYIQPGDTITTLDDTSSIVVELAVPQESAAYITLGQPVTASLTGNIAKTYDGKITAIDSRIDPVTRTLRVEATINNDKSLLLPGAVFAVTAISAGDNALSVPGLALQWDRNGAFVWKREPNGKAVRAAVQILQRSDDVVLVEGDLEANDAIVADGADRVRVGIPLPAKDVIKRPAPSPGGVSTTNSRVQ